MIELNVPLVTLFSAIMLSHYGKSGFSFGPCLFRSSEAKGCIYSGPECSNFRD